MRKSELRQIIKEEISKILNAPSINESLMKIKRRGLPNQKPGTVDTRLIDELLKQIGPNIGYSDWREKIQNPDYAGIIQKIAKHIAGEGVLSLDLLDIKEEISKVLYEKLDDPKYGTDDPRSLDELEKAIVKQMKVKERGDSNIKVNNEINILFSIYKNKGGKKTKKTLEAIARK